MEYEFICSKCRALHSIEKIVIGKKGQALFELACPNKHTDKQFLNAFLIDEWVPNVTKQLYICPKCGLKLTDISRETDDKKTTLILNCPTHFKIKKVVSNEFWYKMVSYKKHIADRVKLQQLPPFPPDKTAPIISPDDSTRAIAFNPKTGYQGIPAQTVPEPASSSSPPITVLPAPAPSHTSHPDPFSSKKTFPIDDTINIESSESSITSDVYPVTNLAETLKGKGLQPTEFQDTRNKASGGIFQPSKPSTEALKPPISKPMTKSIEQELVQPGTFEATIKSSSSKPPETPTVQSTKANPPNLAELKLDLSTFSCPICREAIRSVNCPYCDKITYDVYKCQHCGRAFESYSCENCGNKIEFINL